MWRPIQFSRHPQRVDLPAPSSNDTETAHQCCDHKESKLISIEGFMLVPTRAVVRLFHHNHFHLQEVRFEPLEIYPSGVVAQFDLAKGVHRDGICTHRFE